MEIVAGGNERWAGETSLPPALCPARKHHMGGAGSREEHLLAEFDFANELHPPAEVICHSVPLSRHSS